MLPAIEQLRGWATELGFASLGVADIDLSSVEPGFQAWLDAGFHGELDYMARHGTARTRPAELVPGTLCAVMVTMNYAPADPDWVDLAWSTLEGSEQAYVSRYALGRDYHKVVRARLQKLATRIEVAGQAFGYRVFCDSAPVMEVELARKAGLGWRGKHTLLLDRRQGSMFFIGTLYTDLPLAPAAPATATATATADASRPGPAGPAGSAGSFEPAHAEQAHTEQAHTEQAGTEQADHCGRCQRCIDVCPTRAIVAPYRLDARRCISYLTIELRGSIPLEFRPLLGNRIYGCDDCQLACPWNKFAQTASVPDFGVRNCLDAASLVELFGWTAEQFDIRLAGSPIRRIGHDRWLRNLAVALGNALAAAPAAATVLIRAALTARADDPSALVREHVRWALDQSFPGLPQPPADQISQLSQNGSVTRLAIIDNDTSQAT